MKKGIAVALGATLSLATPGLAMTWDLAADFSAVNNPDGPWQYGWRDASGDFHLEDMPSSPGPYWHYWGSSTDTYDRGGVGLYTGATTDYGIQPGNAILQCDGGDAQVRWIAPVSGRFYICVSIGGTTAWTGSGLGNYRAAESQVDVEGAPIAPTGTWSAPDSGNIWILTENLTAGDTVDAWVPGGQHFAGNTDTMMTITSEPVPEPLTLSTLGIGSLAICLRKGLRKVK